jgi:Zn-dependent membrane protease YugP
MVFDLTGIILMVVIFGVSMAAQGYLTSTFRKFSQIRNARNVTGAEVARDILDSHGLQRVSVEITPGFLTDHYDPMKKVVRLSEVNYNSPSLAALAVAAHEVGHAIQDAKSYAPLVVRSALAGPLMIAANLGQLALFAGLLFLASSLGQTFLLIGIIGLAAVLLFHVITLPVEFDASNRALAILETNGYLSRQENQGAKKVLTAAALTYVVAALASAAQLLYYLGFLRNDE